MKPRDLRHFPETDDPIKLSNDTARAEIQKQIDEYLAKGGVITEADHTANKSWGEPVKRTRREQINTLRRRDRIYARQ